MSAYSLGILDAETCNTLADLRNLTAAMRANDIECLSIRVNETVYKAVKATGREQFFDGIPIIYDSDETINKNDVKEAIIRYGNSDRGKANDFADFIYWIEKELRLE